MASGCKGFSHFMAELLVFRAASLVLSFRDGFVAFAVASRRGLQILMRQSLAITLEAASRIKVATKCREIHVVPLPARL